LTVETTLSAASLAFALLTPKRSVSPALLGACEIDNLCFVKIEARSS
jgi:hypothetical protein